VAGARLLRSHTHTLIPLYPILPGTHLHGMRGPHKLAHTQSSSSDAAGLHGDHSLVTY